MASGSVSGWARAGGGGGRSGGGRGRSFRNVTAATNRRLAGNYMAMNRANRVRGERNATVQSRYY